MEANAVSELIARVRALEGCGVTLPIGDRRAIRTTNLLEKMFGENPPSHEDDPARFSA